MSEMAADLLQCVCGMTCPRGRDEIDDVSQDQKRCSPVSHLACGLDRLRESSPNSGRVKSCLSEDLNKGRP